MVTAVDREHAALRALDTTLTEAHAERGTPTYSRARSAYFKARDKRLPHEDALFAGIAPITTKAGNTDDIEVLVSPEIAQDSVLKNFERELAELGVKPKKTTLKPVASKRSAKEAVLTVGLTLVFVLFNMFAIALLAEHWATVSELFRAQTWVRAHETVGFWIVVILYLALVITVNIVLAVTHKARKRARSTNKKG